MVVAPGNGDLEVPGAWRHKQADTDGRRQVALTSRRRFGRHLIIDASALASLVQVLGTGVVGALRGFRAQRDQKASEVPARRSLRENPGGIAQILRRANQIE